MIAVGEDAPAALGEAVHRARHTGAEGLHAATECVAVRRFDDQVGVIALERVVREPKSRTRTTGSEAPLQLAHDRDRTERRQIGPQPQRHVRWQAAEARAWRMGHARIGTRLSTGPRSAAAPGSRGRQMKHELR